jgi:hypothetical protein
MEGSEMSEVQVLKGVRRGSCKEGTAVQVVDAEISAESRTLVDKSFEEVLRRNVVRSTW